MPQLVEKQDFDLTIGLVILPPEDKPHPNDALQKLYFHKLELRDDENNAYPAQICNTNPKFTNATKGDLVRFHVKSFRSGVYNVEFIKVIMHAPVAANTTRPNNSNVAGTAAAVALTLAVQHFSYKEEKEGCTVIDKAELWYNWLNNKS